MPCGQGWHEASDPGSTPIEPVTAATVFVVNGDDSSISVIDATTDAVAGVHGDTTVVCRARTRHADRSDEGGALDAPNHNAAFTSYGSVWTSQLGSPGDVLSSMRHRSRRKCRCASATTVRGHVLRIGDACVRREHGLRFCLDLSTLRTARSSTRSRSAMRRWVWPASDGRMYVDNEAGKSLTVIDATSRAVVRTMDAHAFAFSADGAKAYVTNQGANPVAVVDVAAKTVTKTIPVGAKPNGIVFHARSLSI